MEDKKYPIASYAPGSYQCKCADCGVIFLGDKRAIQCEPCATEAIQEYESLTPKQKARYDSDRAQIFKLFMELQTLKQQIAASQPTSGQAVWVKASEYKIPHKEAEYRPYRVKNDHDYDYGEIFISRDEEGVFLDIDNESEFLLQTDNRWKDFEILDESGTAAQSGKEEACSFAEFAVQMCWFDDAHRLWNTFDESADPFRYTTSELYELFKKQSNK